MVPCIKTTFFGALTVLMLSSGASAVTCTYTKNNGSSVFNFAEEAASVDIRLGDATIAQINLQCGTSGCSYSEDRGAQGGPLHHIMQYFPDRSEVVYAVHHEHYPARSTIQIYPVDCAP